MIANICSYGATGICATSTPGSRIPTREKVEVDDAQSIHLYAYTATFTTEESREMWHTNTTEKSVSTSPAITTVLLRCAFTRTRSQELRNRKYKFGADPKGSSIIVNSSQDIADLEGSLNMPNPPRSFGRGRIACQIFS